MRNLNPLLGLCNGTRLIVEEMHRSFLTCIIATGSLAKNRVFIPRIELISDADAQLPFGMKRRLPFA